MTLILPGVEIQVVKEIVAGQLNPSGILGLLGVTEENADGKPKKKARASSFKEFRNLFGRSIDYTVPEGKQAFQNGVSEVVMVPVTSQAMTAASLDLKGKSGDTVFKLNARAKGSWANNIKVKIEGKEDDEGNKTMVRCTLNYRDVVEFYDNLYLDPTHDRYFCNVINAQSDLLTATNPGNKKGGKKNNKKEEEAPAEEGAAPPEPQDTSMKELPNDTEENLSGGSSPLAKDFDDALIQLEAEEDVDMVLASIEDYSDWDMVKHVYASIESHCKVLSGNCMNRIGFGSAPPPENFPTVEDEVEFIGKQTLTMNSDRFILVAPHGYAGAVAGLVGNLPVHQSPTFKNLSGIPDLSQKYSPSHLKSLLKSNILTLEAKKGKGIIVEKGIATSGEQISVQRVADKAVRGTKMIGDLFIGTLNNVNGRNALREKCIEFFLQMEKDGAIVPSADGSDPSYKVDVYATDDDISKGIVRVDIAVRPVRAIDYIYGTILVRA
ncbi:phage tail sheath subtilisin-like domain-containing protein [[Eubacterium] cellulosolvens]